MADQRRMRRVWLAFIQQGLQPTGGSIEEEGFDSVGHILFYQSTQPSALSLQPRSLNRNGREERKGREGNRRVKSHICPLRSFALVSLCLRGESWFNHLSCRALMDPIALTRRLIDIESISGNEGAVGAELYEVLLNMGYTTHKMPVAHERFNVVATIDGQKPELVFSTHMDTVPPFISSSEDHDNIYGRGSCDAKGIIAAQIAACQRLRKEGRAVGMLFLVGEERDSQGAKVANENPLGSRFLINGEPTENKIATVVQGRAASSAHSERKDGALGIS